MPHTHYGSSQYAGSADTLARSLGWFSIALGVTELLAPHVVGRAIGTDRHAGLMRACGAREIASGVAILALDDPAPGVWSRVAGDVVDVATLTRDVIENPRSVGAGVALGAVAAVTALDVYCATQLGRESRTKPMLQIPDYSNRSGFPDTPDRMRGRARAGSEGSWADGSEDLTASISTFEEDRGGEA